MNLHSTIQIHCLGPDFETHDYDEPAPEDVKKINKRGYKSGMKKAKTSPRFPLNSPPGAQPLQPIQGSPNGGHETLKLKKGLSKKEAWRQARKKASQDFRGIKYDPHTGLCILT